jgi:hypothetical protein
MEVSLQQFGKVLGWFGPLEPQHFEGAFLDRVCRKPQRERERERERESEIPLTDDRFISL